jgi:hypothetical protein
MRAIIQKIAPNVAQELIILANTAVRSISIHIFRPQRKRKLGNRGIWWRFAQLLVLVLHLAFEVLNKKLKNFSHVGAVRDHKNAQTGLVWFVFWSGGSRGSYKRRICWYLNEKVVKKCPPTISRLWKFDFLSFLCTVDLYINSIYFLPLNWTRRLAANGSSLDHQDLGELVRKTFLACLGRVRSSILYSMSVNYCFFES